MWEEADEERREEEGYESFDVIDFSVHEVTLRGEFPEMDEGRWETRRAAADAFTAGLIADESEDGE
ncbi:hypothetical protein CV102_17685 [Natronococcus pandeyae]|uniref:Uncharacterized protein n=1 Tax=Natronococcus pandeyae TaxID=2055836 RepID=A0A8J8Q1X0_9EURY|nr:hypothetical protein [Natronococcus pandeyae]TYL37437.1 hypothetical protein CV102_17685 [Natronococcus pandeyae]